MLTYLDSRRIINNGMLLSFIIIVIISALRLEYGNDYDNYNRIFDRISSRGGSLMTNIKNEYNLEVGWVTLCYLFKNLGYYSLIAFIAIFNNVIYYITIKKYVPRKWYWFAVFVYLFTPSLFLLQLSMIRQSLAISLFLLALPYMENKQILKSLLLVYIASLFHRSALILLPFTFCGFIKNINEKKIVFAYILIYVLILTSTFLFENVLNSILLLEAFSSYDEFYSNFTNEQTFGLGYILNTIPFLVLLIFISKGNKKPMYILASITALVIPFSQYIQLIDRVSYYFSIFTIITIPISYLSIRNRILKYGLVFVYFFVTLIFYFSFFYSDTYHDFYSTYKTILK